jgi:hypothetical protein
MVDNRVVSTNLTKAVSLFPLFRYMNSWSLHPFSVKCFQQPFLCLGPTDRVDHLGKCWEQSFGIYTCIPSVKQSKNNGCWAPTQDPYHTVVKETLDINLGYLPSWYLHGTYKAKVLPLMTPSMHVIWWTGLLSWKIHIKTFYLKPIPISF